MSDSEKTQPLDYESLGESPASNWPVWLYVLAILWAFLTLHAYNAATSSYRETINAQLRTQVALLFLAALRLAWALYKRERSKGWVFYVLLLFLALPVWILVAPPIAKFGRSFWGGPVLP